MEAQDFAVSDLSEVLAAASDFDAPAEHLDNVVPLLYQAGYLTIKGFDPDSGLYALGVPNREVSLGLAEGLVGRSGLSASTNYRAFRAAFSRAFKTGDIDGALSRLRSYLAGVPFDLAANNEKGFQAALWYVFTLSDLDISTEVRTASIGSIDAVVRCSADNGASMGGVTYVMEFKYGKSAEEALAQIDERGYALPYVADGGQVIKVGVSFDSSTRTIGEWLVAKV